MLPTCPTAYPRLALIVKNLKYWVTWAGCFCKEHSYRNCLTTYSPHLITTLFLYLSYPSYSLPELVSWSVSCVGRMLEAMLPILPTSLSFINACSQQTEWQLQKRSNTTNERAVPYTVAGSHSPLGDSHKGARYQEMVACRAAG